MLVSELKQNGVVAPDGEVYTFPQEFLDCLPEKCSCGGDLQINETLTALTCVEPRCLNKVVQRTVSMLAYMGVLGMGEAKCRDFFSRVNVRNPYIIFAVNPNKDYKIFEGVFSKEFLENIISQVNARNSMTLAEYIKIGFFPGIQDSAFKLFKDYSDINQFYADLENPTTGGAKFIAGLMGLDVDSKSVIETCKTLVMFKPDIVQGVQWVNIRQSVKSLNVCISTAVGGRWKTKNDFVHDMNNLYGDKVYLNYLSSVTKTCDYLILADKTATTNKAEKARKFNVPIYSGEEFEELLKKL